MKLMKAATETVRQETFQGRDFTVVPVIAIVEGVLQAANSPQPELVRASEFDPASWNGRPITFGHPAIGETLVSASASPEVFEQVAVGTIFNSVIIDGTKLRVEAWIDNKKVEEQGDEAIATFARILAGEAVEVSTGYFADSIQEEGRFDGEKFEAVQSDIKPDHLAILVGDDIGACSLEDGCGTNRVNVTKKTGQANDHTHTFDNADSGTTSEDDGHTHGYSFGDSKTGETNGHAHELDFQTNRGTPFANVQRFENKGKVTKNSGHDDDEEEEEDEEEENSGHEPKKRRKKKSNLRELLQMTELKDNGEISDMDVRGAISSALEAKGESFWAIVAVFQNNFIMEKNFGTLERREFSISDNGEITIANEGEDVRPVTEFIPVKANKNNQENRVEKKEQMVNDLIANEATQMTEDDREFLMGLDESKLGILAPVEVEKKEGEDEEGGVPDDGVKAESKEGDPKPPVTTEEFIKNAPDEIKEVLNQGVKLQKEQRSNLTKMIIDNSKFSEDELKGFSIDQLDKLAATAAPADHSMKGAPISNLGDNNDNIVPTAKQAWPIGGHKKDAA